MSGVGFWTQTYYLAYGLVMEDRGMAMMCRYVTNYDVDIRNRCLLCSEMQFPLSRNICSRQFMKEKRFYSFIMQKIFPFLCLYGVTVKP